MNSLRNAYKIVSEHIGKILSAIGALILTVDVSSVAGLAHQYLPEKAARYVGIGVFILLFFRTWYAGYKNQQLKQQIEDMKK